MDTHRQVHVAAVITAVGAMLASASFPATAAGYRDLITWARSWGDVLRAGVEGTGSYGVGLSRALRTEDIEVVEINRPDRAVRRLRGKTDTVDAEAAARAALAGAGTATPKSADGPVEAMWVLKLAKDSAMKARVQTHRHRLNRGGHRQANAALYRAILSQLRWDERTRTYLQRRIGQGLSKREIIRCLKRYLARSIYKIITAPPATSEPMIA